MVGVNFAIPSARLSYFGGLEAFRCFGDLNQHGPDSIRFYTKTKTVTARWPSGTREGAELSFDDEVKMQRNPAVRRAAKIAFRDLGSRDHRRCQPRWAAVSIASGTVATIRRRRGIRTSRSIHAYARGDAPRRTTCRNDGTLGTGINRHRLLRYDLNSAVGALEGHCCAGGRLSRKAFASRKWTFEQNSLVLRNHNGEPLAQLGSAEPGKLEGRSTHGERFH